MIFKPEKNLSYTDFMDDLYLRFVNLDHVTAQKNFEAALSEFGTKWWHAKKRLNDEKK
ncbi:MAG TPA: hypothetical protein PLH37_02020 [bacterium]|nr:hypothetical protein [bacterium]